MTFKVVGVSGRIVIDVDPEVKCRLYAALALNGSTLKDWFLENASNFCDQSQQLQLFKKQEHSSSRSRGESNVD